MRASLTKMMSLTLSACLAVTTLTAMAPKAMADTDIKLTDASLTDSQPMGITIDDLVRFSPSRIRDASLLQTLIRSGDSRIFQNGESLCNVPMVGITRTLKNGRTLTAKTDVTSICGGAYLQAAPHGDGNDSIYPFAILMNTQQGAIFRKVNIIVSQIGKQREVTNIEIQRDVPLSQTHFSVSVGLVPNIQVVQDVQDGILVVSPIGNGGLSLDAGGERHILTPMYKHAMLRKDVVIPSLGPPVEDAYYRMKPYIALVNSKGAIQPIAFHVTILSDGLWNGGAGSEFLVRGYQSHGCMRMRLHDLMVLYTIVSQSAGPLPVTVDYFAALMDLAGQPIMTAWDPINTVQPYTLTHNSYFQEKNQSAPGMPAIAARDTDPNITHHLIVMESTGGTVPYSKLARFDGDDTVALKDYQALLAKQTGVKHKVVAKKPAPAPKAIDVAPDLDAPPVQPLAAQ